MNKFAIDDAGSFRGRRQQPQHEQNLQLVVERYPDNTTSHCAEQPRSVKPLNNIKLYSSHNKWNGL